MTRTHLRWVLASVIALYAPAIGVGTILRVPLDENPRGAYTLYKDLLPLIIAIPAAYLAFAFQRRNSYLQALRGLWRELVAGVSSALAYADTTSPTEDEYLATLTKLSAAIEEVRGVFKNVPARGVRGGWYPFEPVKQIYRAIHDLGFGASATPERRAAVRESIFDMWKRSREQLLVEFDRDEPTHHHAGYAPTDFWAAQGRRDRAG